MKFEKLNLNAFSKKELTNNSLRSINGGWAGTCHTDGSAKDQVDNDGCTFFYDDQSYNCDTSACS